MPTWKFSSRALLVLTAFAAMGVASLRFGGTLAAITVGSIAVFAAALVIVALIDCAGRRAFAIGFLVPCAAYSGIHLIAGGNQLNPFEDSAIATTRSLGPLYKIFRTANWIDTSTGDVIPDYDPTANPTRHQIVGPGIPFVQFSQTPDQETFTLVAHSLIAVLLGLIGSLFAIYIYQTQDGG